MNHTLLLGRSALAALGVALVAGPLCAQSTIAPQADTANAPSTANGAGGGEIIVTGSRIRHNPLDQPAPVTFVDKADIDRTGLSSIADEPLMKRIESTSTSVRFEPR